MSWTEERVEKLRELWADGLTASQIAKSLGGVSRNAVIGKVHRLGLSHRAAGQKVAGPEAEEPVDVTQKETTAKNETVAPEVNEQPVEPTEAAAEPRRVVEIRPAREAEPSAPAAEDAPAELNPVAALAAEVERNSRKLTLLDLNERTCKWPIGDPSTNDFYFCGAPCEPGKPYCSAHVAVAYQPMSSRRDRDRNRARAATA